jgi:hypothetical protein
LRRPQLSNSAAFYYEAFGRLSLSRPPGFGVLAAIPVSEVVAYMDGLRMNDLDERDTLMYMILALDSDYREHFNKDPEPKKGNSKSGSS